MQTTTQSRGWLSRIRNSFDSKVKEPIQEIIGRVGYHMHVKYAQRVMVDYTQVDAEYWDNLRRGKKAGFEIGGLFAKPIVEIITSWVLGDSFTVSTGDENTDSKLSEFIGDNLLTFITTHEDMLALGNSYIVINADGSLTLVPTSQVDIVANEENHKLIDKATITTQDTELGIEIVDEYTATERKRIVKRTRANKLYSKHSESSNRISEETYPNLIGRVPVVHWANDRSANEVFGHPIYEALLTLFAEYDDVIRKGIDGVKLMSNPTPTFEKLENPQAAQANERSYTDNYTNAKGVRSNEDISEFSPQDVIYTSGEFSYKSPGNFTPNTVAMLKKLFQVMLQHTQVPEWVWGGAISSSNASVDAQLPAFARFISLRRLKVQEPLREIIQIWLLVQALFTPNIVTDARISFEWSNLIPENEDARLKWTQYLDGKGYIQKTTAVKISGLVDDAEAEVGLAQQEMIDLEIETQRQIDDDIEKAMQERESRLQTENRQEVTAA